MKQVHKIFWLWIALVFAGCVSIHITEKVDQENKAKQENKTKLENKK